MNRQTKLKISYSLRGRKKSATHAHRIAESLRGQKKTDEHKKAISDAMRKLWRERKESTTYTDVKTCKFAPLIIK
jgi:hypothetical protein